MKPVVRLGAVNYLNVRPLVSGLAAHPEFSLRFDPPSVCAQLLAEGAIDLGMVPSIAYLDRPEDRIVPGIAIGSDGPVGSVALFSRVPAGSIRQIALDTSSRTSAVLVRILCRRRFRIAPTFVARPPDLEGMLAAADAALVIGDAALFADHRALGVEKWDLGALWTEMTGLPFVWAFWAGRAGSADPRTVSQLQDAARQGRARLDEIAAEYSGGSAVRAGVGARYLRENLVFDFSPQAQRGLLKYYEEARDLGLAPANGSLTFFADR